MDLTINHRLEGTWMVMSLGGEIDVYTAPLLRERWVELINAGSYHYVMDLTDVTFLDSTGLGILVGGTKRLQRHDGSIKLVCGAEKILKVFQITGLNKAFAIYPTLAEALQ